jgi:hypothetical protein
VATVLFTDIAGSTDLAARLGDAPWRSLLSTYRDRVRRELAASHGREVDAAGDGFFALFDVPADALRCAARIRTVAGDVGLEVRSGIHTGEIDLEGRRATGIGIHIAARIQAAAAPSAILASSTTRDLSTGSGFGFGPSEEHELRGVPGRWQLSAVTDVPQDVLGESPGRRAVVNRPLVGGALLVSLAAVALALAALNGTFGPGSPKNLASPGASGTPPSTPSATGAPSSPLTTASPPPSARADASSTVESTEEPQRFTDGVRGSGRYVLATVPGQPDVTLTGDWFGFSGPNYEVIKVNTRKGDSIAFAAATTVASDPCGTKQSPLVGDPATAYLEWLRGNRALHVGPGVLRGAGEDASTAVDVEVNAAEACAGDPATVSIVTVDVSPSAVNFPPPTILKAGSTARLLIHSLGNRVLVVAVQAPTQAEFDSFLPQADGVLESIHFESQ